MPIFKELPIEFPKENKPTLQTGFSVFPSLHSGHRVATWSTVDPGVGGGGEAWKKGDWYSQRGFGCKERGRNKGARGLLLQ